MIGTSQFPAAPSAVVHELEGIEFDNLLGFLALLGLLRALEAAAPELHPRVSWSGPPWKARLHLAAELDQSAVARAADEGIMSLVSDFDVDGRSDVKFSREEFRSLAWRVRSNPVAAGLSACLARELPPKRDGSLQAAPLVMMFGQGHQHFLDRLLSVPKGELPKSLQKRKPKPNLREPSYIASALFEPWKREDPTDAFRWDPEEDQRYALRYDNPSTAGAAPTVHGANRLAAVGFLSFACMPRSEHAQKRTAVTPGVVRRRGELSFIWPIWTSPLSRVSIEGLLGHPLILGDAPDLEALRVLGIADVMRARRIANGKFMNVARASSVVGAPA